MFDPWKNKNKLYSVDKYRGVHMFGEGCYHIPEDSVIFRTRACDPVPVWSYTPPAKSNWKLGYVVIELEFYRVPFLVYAPPEGFIDYCTSATYGMSQLLNEQHVDASRAKTYCLIGKRCFLLPNLSEDWVEVKEYAPSSKMMIQNIGDPFDNQVSIHSVMGTLNTYVTNTRVVGFTEFWQMMCEAANVVNDDCVTISLNDEASWSFCVYNGRC